MKINKIYNIDCFEGFKQLKDNSVDFTFTSPPFKSDMVKGYRKSRIKSEDIEGDYWIWYDRFMSEVLRVTKEYAFIFNSSTRQVQIIKRYPEPERILIWVKPIVLYSYKYNPLFVYKSRLSSFRINKYLYSDVFPYMPQKNKKHPYQDPLNLYVALLKMLPKNKKWLVLDPCIGFGTTAAACKLLDLNFLGFEKEKKYYDLRFKAIAQRSINNYETIK